ncbi:MAG TPA: glycosyltransferase family 4 protein [Thermodesulfobacteriota bacterium]|nr:glycosyltransferase family 4 protein [Thermodesulfobacteriota bacterium]
MNICIITSSFPSRRDDTVQVPFLVEFIGELKKRGHHIFVFTQDRHGEKEEFLEDVKINWFPWVKSDKPLVRLNLFKPLDFFRIVNLLHRGKMALPPFIRENKIEICLSLWVLPGGYFANHALRQTNVPYSVWSLGSDIYRYGRNPFLFFVMKRIIREARGVFADGFDLSKRVEERFGRKCFFLATTRTIPPSLPKEIPPDGPSLSPSLLLDGGKKGLSKERHGVSTSEPYCFLFVGRIEKVKGIDLLLESMASLKKEALNIHLTVVGRGGMEEWAKRFIKERDLGRDVSWMGNVSDQTLASFYESSDCVVIPSRSESIPLVFSEALRFNKKLIVTDVGDMGTLGRQYGVAWVIPPENIRALEEAMKLRVDVENQENEEKNEAGREELKHLFNLETSVERFLADYK